MPGVSRSTVTQKTHGQNGVRKTDIRGRRTGHAHIGVPQEPGRPRRLLGRSRPEVPGHQLQARGRRIRRPRERNADATGVPPCEGNEARRDGQRGVGASHSTADAGEPTRGNPAEGRGRRAMRPPEGKMPGTPSPDPISTRRRRIAELARQSPQAALTLVLQHRLDESRHKEVGERRQVRARKRAFGSLGGRVGLDNEPERVVGCRGRKSDG